MFTPLPQYLIESTITLPSLSILKMSSLTEITAETSNPAKRRSNASANLKALNSTRLHENFGKRRSPKFMAPTLSSANQNTANSLKPQDPLTPPLAASSRIHGSSWMVSAAKRVGFKRGGDGTPRSRKGGLSPRPVIFPDQVRAFSLRWWSR